MGIEFLYHVGEVEFENNHDIYAKEDILPWEGL
jgi:hypothetical protein